MSFEAIEETKQHIHPSSTVPGTSVALSRSSKNAKLSGSLQGSSFGRALQRSSG